MFISESVLNRGITGNINSLALLESMSYLESTYHPAMIPIVENSRLNAYVVDVEDVLRLSEETGEEFDDAVISVAESNGIDPEDVILSIDEVAAYENDGIEDLLKVLPQNDFVYNLMEAVVNEAWETGDYDFIMEATLFDEKDKDIKNNFVKKIYNSAPLKYIPNKAKGYVAATTDVAAGVGGAMALDIGAGSMAAGLGAGPIGAAIVGVIASLPALVHAYHAGGRLGVSIRDKFVTKKSKDFGEGVYFDKSVEKLKKIAQGIDKNPRSYSVRAVSSLEKLQTKWANNMQSASDPKQKGTIAKFVDVIGQTISAAKMKIAGDKGKQTKGVHESYFGEAAITNMSLAATLGSMPTEQEIEQSKQMIENYLKNGESGLRAQTAVAKVKTDAKNILMLKKPRIFISNKLRQFKGWLQKVEDNINKVPQEKRGILMKIKAKIVSIIKWLTEKLENFVRPDSYYDLGIDSNGKVQSVKLKNDGNNVFTRDGGATEKFFNRIGRTHVPEFKDRDVFRHHIDMSK